MYTSTSVELGVDDMMETIRTAPVRSILRASASGRAEVRDIGYTGSAGAYPRRIRAPTLGMPAAALPSLPPMPSDLLIVQKRNPVDP